MVRKSLVIILGGLLSAVSILAKDEVTFQMLQKKFNIPQNAQKVVEYYITRLSKAPAANDQRLYVRLYEYINSTNLSERQKSDLITAIASLTAGTNKPALQNKIAEIKRNFGKLDVLEQEDMDIDALRQ